MARVAADQSGSTGVVTAEQRRQEAAGAEALAAEERVFLRQRASLLRRYEGQYVALYGGRVVGHGADDEELASRLFAQLGDVPFFIARVERVPTAAELPSPEWVG